MAVPKLRFDSKTRTLSIRHTHSKDVDIQGKDEAPASLITFDDPHLPAGTVLTGHDQSGVIDWGSSEWKIETPYGKFGTFTLALADPAAQHAAFRFYSPRVFEGFDVCNGGDSDARITLRSPETPELVVTVKAKELLRLKTQWHDVSSQISIDIKGGDQLRFDNLAYLRP